MSTREEREAEPSVVFNKVGPNTEMSTQLPRVIFNWQAIGRGKLTYGEVAGRHVVHLCLFCHPAFNTVSHFAQPNILSGVLPVQVVTEEAKGVVVVLGQLPTEFCQLRHSLPLICWRRSSTSRSRTRSPHPVKLKRVMK